MLIFGSILSSVDSIELNSILKEVYAPDQLESLIIGESLINGAIILALFDILLITGDDISGIGAYTSLFLRLILGGFLLGISFAFVMGKFVKRMINDTVQEINSCIITAYLLFWTCNYSKVDFSEGLSVITFGIYLAANYSTIISTEVHEKLKQLLHICSKDIESISFVIAGVLFSNTLMYSSDSLTSFDYAVLIILFPILYIIRAISLLLHYPLLKHAGYGLNPRELVTLIFSGLKGVISTSISLTVFHANDVGDAHFQSLALYLGIGTTGMSVLFGSLIFKLIVKYLGLEDLNEVEENMLLGVTNALVEASDKKLEELHGDKSLTLVNWDEVIEITGTNTIAQDLAKTLKFGKALIQEYSNLNAKEMLNLFSKIIIVSKSAIKIEMRRRYLSTLKGIY